MNDLIQEYKRTLKDTKTLLPIRKTKLLRAKQIQDIEEIKRLENEIKTINSWISNLQYVIQWLRTGRQPGTTRGVENRAAYQREIPVPCDWLHTNIKVDSLLEEKTAEEVENQKMKEQLIKDIMKNICKEDGEIFTMYANNYSQEEIAKAMNVTRDQIKRAIVRCKRIIKKEGWVMV